MNKKLILSVGALFMGAHLHGLLVGAFDFDGLPSVEHDDSTAVGADESERMASRETLELVRAYYRISSPTIRKKLVDLARALGREAEADEAA